MAICDFYAFVMVFLSLLSITELEHAEDVESVFQRVLNLRSTNEKGEISRLCRQKQSSHACLDSDWIESKQNNVEINYFFPLTMIESIELFGKYELYVFHRVVGPDSYWHIPKRTKRTVSIMFMWKFFFFYWWYRSFNRDLNTILACWATMTLIVLLHRDRIIKISTGLSTCVRQISW